MQFSRVFELVFSFYYLGTDLKSKVFHFCSKTKHERRSKKLGLLAEGEASNERDKGETNPGNRGQIRA